MRCAVLISLLAHGIFFLPLKKTEPIAFKTAEKLAWVESAPRIPVPSDVRSIDGVVSSKASSSNGFSKLEDIIREGNSRPAYPEEALRKGWEGNVLLKLSLNSVGKVTDAQVIKSSGHVLLDLAAKTSAETWKVSSNEPSVVVPVEFKISN